MTIPVSRFLNNKIIVAQAEPNYFNWAKVKINKITQMNLISFVQRNPYFIQKCYEARKFNLIDKLLTDEIYSPENKMKFVAALLAVYDGTNDETSAKAMELLNSLQVSIAYYSEHPNDNRARNLVIYDFGVANDFLNATILPTFFTL